MQIKKDERELNKMIKVSKLQKTTEKQDNNEEKSFFKHFFLKKF